VLQVAGQREQHRLAALHVDAGEADAVGSYARPALATVSAQQQHVEPPVVQPPEVALGEEVAEQTPLDAQDVRAVQKRRAHGRRKREREP
jgi:hypothetical protein